MSRVMGYGIVCLLVLLITHYSLLITPVYAVQSSNSAILASPSTKPSPSPNSLIDKLNAIKAEVASKAALFKIEINKKIQNKALIGYIKSKSETEVVINTKNGEKKVMVNEFTSYQSKARKPGLDDMDPGDYIASLGDMDDKNNLVAKKIVWLTKPEQVAKTFFWGQVQSVNGATLVLKSKAEKNTTIITKPSTEFVVGSDETTLSGVKINKFISGVGVANSEGGIDAQFVYIIPTTGSSSAKITR